MDDLITARYHLTEADYCDVCVANHRYLWRRSPILKVARVFFFGLVAVVGGVLLIHPERLAVDLPISLLALGGLAYLFHPRNFLNRLWYRHNFQSVSEGIRSIEWGFDPDILWSRSTMAEGTYRWELFPTIVETPRCFLFFQSQRKLILWLPSHAFSSPGMLRMFSDLARTKVPNYVVLGECQFPAKPEPIGLQEL